jgi:hypothetical protein
MPFGRRTVSKHELAIDLHALELLPALSATADFNDRSLR